MSVLAWQQAITERLRLIPGLGERVYVGGVPEGVNVPRFPGASGVLKPYITLWFGGQAGAGFGTRGICGVRGDLKRGLLIAVCHAQIYDHVEQCAQLVRDALEGYMPNDEGELSEDPVTIRDPGDQGGVPVRYSVPLPFSGMLNS